MRDLIIFAPRAVCAEKAKEYEIPFGNDMWRKDYIGMTQFSVPLDRRVQLTFTDVDYTYSPKDFAECEDPEWMVYSPDKHKVDWVEHPQYFNA